MIVVAEGAAEACLDENLETEGTDPSGNPILFDIGGFLKKEIVKYCSEKGINATLKYIDPSYIIRTAPANSADKMLCTILAQCAVNGAMAGYTGFTVGTVNNNPVLIPVDFINNFKSV